MELIAATKLSSALPPRQELPRKPQRSRDLRLFTAPNFHNVDSGEIRRNLLQFQAPLSAISALCFPLPTLASEAEPFSDKISVESVLASVDNFFIRYPFVGPAVGFIWLVIFPLAREYLKKYKSVSAVDAFVKLKEDPGFQLLDIRKEESRNLLDSPDLTCLKKSVVQVEFSEGQETAFVAKILKSLRDPANTSVCVLDNFDDNSLKVAELLVKNGFKEAYAIKGGLRGKDGWQMIQETLLPPDVRVYPRENKSSDKPVEKTKNSLSRSSSPYPNYPDLKPPSSPTPSKP